MKKFTFSLVLYLSFFSIWSFYRLDGFQVSKVKRSNKAYNEPILDSSFEKIKHILDGEFVYLGKGHQCFVFESKKDDYVIKLLNYRRFNLPVSLRPFEFIPYLKKKKLFRSSRLQPSLDSYLLANNSLKKESGIVYVKMQNSSFHKVIKLKDNAKNLHKVDLYDVDFILQKKAKPIFEHLEELYQANKDRFKESITSFLNVVFSRISKNIVDDDLDVEINYGFCDKNAILIDPGRIFVDEKLVKQANREKEILKSTKKLRAWILNKYPEMVLFFDQQIAKKITSS